MLIPRWLVQYFPKEGTSIEGEDSWRNVFLRPFIFERENYICWVEGCFYTATDLHEAILSRQDVRGWPLKRRSLIHSPFNCIAVCKEHHKWIPDKRVVLDRMVAEYGLCVVDWFDSLPFKGPNPIRGLLNKYYD